MRHPVDPKIRRPVRSSIDDLNVVSESNQFIREITFFLALLCKSRRRSAQATRARLWLQEVRVTWNSRFKVPFYRSRYSAWIENRRSGRKRTCAADATCGFDSRPAVSAYAWHAQAAD